MKTKSFIPAFAAAVLVLLTSCGGQNQQPAVQLSGAGATFPEPFYSMAFSSFSAAKGHTVSYGGIGSGGGVRNLKDQIVDFAGSDAFLSDEEMSDIDPVVHIPTCMGAVVLSYNIPDLKELRLSGDVVADIFAGIITRWDDVRIRALNPLIKLPNKEIVPIFRSDGSGTTFVFSYYLSQVSESWKQNFGASKSVDFPRGQAAKGNPGVAGLVSQTPYSIGYIGSEYAFVQNLPMATLQNASGKFVEPTLEAISAAAKGNLPEDTRTMITNSPERDAYPISCFTWLILYQEQHYADRSEDQARATVELMEFMLSSRTQQSAPLVKYAPLPKSMVETSLRNLKQVCYDGKPILK